MLLLASDLRSPSAPSTAWCARSTASPSTSASARSLGVVGESGSGKTVSLMSVMGLINDPNAVIEGSIRLQGPRAAWACRSASCAHVRGSEIAMIFQDPMTALTPVYTIGWQIEEQVRDPPAPLGQGRRASARSSCWPRSASPTRRCRSTAIPTSSPAACASARVIAMALSCNPSLLHRRRAHDRARRHRAGADPRADAEAARAISAPPIVLITHDMGVVAEVADRVHGHVCRPHRRARRQARHLRARRCIPTPGACSIRSRRWTGRGRIGCHRSPACPPSLLEPAARAAPSGRAAAIASANAASSRAGRQRRP